jgi:hypothetical protein
VKRKHSELDESFSYSIRNFPSLLPALVKLIATNDASQTQAQTEFDLPPSHAAFTCVSNLAPAADEPAVVLMLPFVAADKSVDDWCLRHASALLLGTATQLPSFHEQVRNILFAFDFFGGGICYRIARISEPAM